MKLLLITKPADWSADFSLHGQLFPCSANFMKKLTLTSNLMIYFCGNYQIRSLLSTTFKRFEKIFEYIKFFCVFNFV